MRSAPSGQAVTTFGIATNREWITANGERKSSTEFHDLVAWAKLAEICQQYLKKGKLIYVEGYLKTRSWETPEGIKKFKTEVIIQDMIILEKRAKTDDENLPIIETDEHQEEIDTEDLNVLPIDDEEFQNQKTTKGGSLIDRDLGL
ncbi:hypothetical protein A2229_04745 [Candidatus Peregrinibacteria bacterium RIFOXYA2_FULL_33_7]|nr:MAG: hypothetical protein A2229_04745 [Candidatus Peregrinibacteria bacterium RIFOXYA2_FULL_33_7]